MKLFEEHIVFYKEGLIFLFIAIGFFVFLKLQPSNGISSQKRFEEKLIMGKVVDKYYDKKNHYVATLVIDNNNEKSKLIFNNEKSGFYHFVNIGDSVLKSKGESTIKLIRGEIDTSFVIDFNYLESKNGTR